MNDDELITLVRESVTGVHMTTPEEQILRRGRTLRARRRIPTVVGALAVAAGAALAATTLGPFGHQPGGHPLTAQLAAWTVSQQANGDIDVTVRQLQDPAGLQSTLRAEGLPVNVTFSGSPLSSSCQPYAGSRDALSAVVQRIPSDGNVFVIDASALPSGAGISIFDEPGLQVSPTSTLGSGTPPPAGITGPLSFGLVYASPQCTG